MSYLIPSRSSLNYTAILSDMSSPESAFTHLLALSDDSPRQIQLEHLSCLPESFRQMLFGQVQALSGQRVISEAHLLKSLSNLQEAVRRTANDLFQALDFNGQAEVQDAIDSDPFNMVEEENPLDPFTSELLRSFSGQSEKIEANDSAPIDNTASLLLAMHKIYGNLTPECLRSLDEWASEGGPDEQREEARLRILECAIDNMQDVALDLSNLGLRSLPPSLEGLRHITGLSLQGNELFEFPKTLLHLNQLQALNLSDNPISSIPREIGHFQQLRSLFLEETCLTWLPETIGDLSRLEELSVKGTPTLEGLPNELLQLQQGCQINVSECALSKQVQKRIQQFTMAVGYHGPNIAFTVEDVLENQSGELRPLSALISELFMVSGLQEKPFSHLDQLTPQHKRRLQSWLSRLSETADYGRKSSVQQAFATQILHYLCLADEDSTFRHQFLTLLSGAAKTCGDRIALSILHIGLAAKRMGLKKAVETAKDPKSLLALQRYLIQTALPLDLLETIARSKTKALPFVDELQIYLAFPIVLRERLSMDLDVQSIRFLNHVMNKPERPGLCPKDFDEAERLVRCQQASPESCSEFLTINKDWQEALEITHPEQCNALREIDYKELEEVGNLPEQRERRWSKLTQQVLIELGIGS